MQKQQQIKKQSLLLDVDFPPIHNFSLHFPNNIKANDIEEIEEYYLNNNKNKETHEEQVLNQEGEGDGEDDEGEVDAYSCDDFRIYEFKVRRCVRGRSHDWTDCPFAHPGEKARRRDPRRFHYSGTPCPDYRRAGDCTRGDACEFSHGIFEVWLHPARYRTMPCKDGRRCRRKVCFFAHTAAQLRIVHPSSSPPSPSYGSPTSILMGLASLTPPVSPTVSPRNLPAPKAKASRSPAGNGFDYRALYNELLNSVEVMQLCASTDDAAAGCETRITATALAPEGKHQQNNAATGFLSNLGPDLGWVDELLLE